MADDTSILSGGTPDEVVNVPMPAPTQQDTTPAPVSQTLQPETPTAPDVQAPQGPAPDISTLTGPQQQPAAPAAPPQAAGQPSVWKDLVMGALHGLAGSAGARHFGGGLAGGAAGELQAEQLATENKRADQQLQFESVRAADSHILALKQAQEADSATEEHKVNLIEHQQQVNEYATEHGQAPVFTISGDSPSDMHAQATGGLQTLGNRNGGTIPQVTTTNAPATASDPNHKIDVYSPTVQDVKTNPNGSRQVVDDARAIQGLPPIDDASWNAGANLVKGNAFAGQKQLVSEAQQRLFSVPSPSDKPAENAATAAHLQQQLDTYKQTPNANAAVTKLLQTQLDTFNSAAENQRAKTATAESNTTLETAPADAYKAQQVKLAEANTPQGRAELQKTQQEIIDSQYKNADAHQKSLFDEGVDPLTKERLNLSNAPDEALVDQRTGQPIPTKLLSTLKPTQQESNRGDFAKSTLHTLDLIDGLRAKGTVPNGPISGLTAKVLVKAGLSPADAQEAYSYIQLAQSSATGAHVGGRFNVPIMEKMQGLLALNMNDAQFDGAEKALRNVMEPYAQQGGRETVGQYKSEMIGSTQTLKNGQKVKVTGIDKNGQFIGTPAQ